MSADILEMVRNARKTGHGHNCECRECASFLYPENPVME